MAQPGGQSGEEAGPERVTHVGVAVDSLPAQGHEVCGHGYRWEDERWKEEPQLPDGSFGAMGGLWTSARDLARYAEAMADRDEDGDDVRAVPLAQHVVHHGLLVAVAADRGVLREGAPRRA